MTRQQTEEVVLTVLSAVLKCRVDADSSRRSTPKWDSLKHIEVIFTLEDELDMQFSEAEMADMDSVKAIVDLAAGRHAP